jgi:UDP-N-acetylglucosamine 1-carboxyvinyltransferase
MFFTDKLVGMGANIILCDLTAALSRPSQLFGEKLESPDIRAGMALVWLPSAQGIRVRNVGRIDRGHEQVDKKLASWALTSTTTSSN